jgi:hypothetical protein
MPSASLVAIAALASALPRRVRLALALCAFAAPAGLALLPDPAAALTLEIRDRADTLIVEVRAPERRTRIRAIDPVTLEATTISEGSLLMVPVGVTLAPNGDLLISRSPDGAGDPERIRPVDAGAPAPGFALRQLHRLDLFVLAGGPRESGGAFTVYFPDGTTALFLDGRFFSEPASTPTEVPRPTLVSEIDTGATLLIPLDSGWMGAPDFVIESLFDPSDEGEASLTLGELGRRASEPDLPGRDLEAVPDLLLRR